MRVILLFAAALVLLTAALFVAFSVVIVPGLNLKLMDSNGKPLSGCFIVYDYQLYANFDPKPGSILETDSQGNVRIPLKLIHKHPLLTFNPKIRMWCIYSPRMHNATEVYAWPASVSLKGIVDARPKERKITFYDLSDYPADWFAALNQMQNVLLHIPRGENRVGEIWLEKCENEKRKLFLACSNDVALFRSRYYSTAYSSPRYSRVEDDYRASSKKTFGEWTDQFLFRYKD